MSKSKKNPNTITTMAGAEEAMKRLDEIDRTLNVVELAEATEIHQVRVKYAEERLKLGAASLDAERKSLEKQLFSFAKGDKKNWEGKQNIHTKFGRFGFHAGQPKVLLVKKVSKNFEQALATLSGGNWGDFLIRTRDELDKEKILRYAAELKNKEGEESESFFAELAEAGLKVDREESFTISTSAALDLKASLEKLEGGA